MVVLVYLRLVLSFFVSTDINEGGTSTKRIKANEYGGFRLALKELMDDKDISINEMSRYAKVRYETVRKYYNNDCYWYDAEILAKFCYVLECNINELLIYESKKTLQNAKIYN